MAIAYGIDVNSVDDSYVAIAERALEGLSEAAVPGAYMVDQIPLRELRSVLEIVTAESPLVKYIPSWLPGGRFKVKAAGWRALADAMPNKPFQAVKDALVSPSIPCSFCLLTPLSEARERDPVDGRDALGEPTRGRGRSGRRAGRAQLRCRSILWRRGHDRCRRTVVLPRDVMLPRRPEESAGGAGPRRGPGQAPRVRRQGEPPVHQ